VVKGDKALLKDSDIIPSEIYRFKEFTAINALKLIENHADSRKYVPEDWFTTKRANREYLWKVIASVRFNFVEQVHHHAIKQRQARQGLKPQQAPLHVSNELATLIAAHPFQPK
jgi:hypothetical protein